MNILAIEHSTATGSIAILDGKNVLRETTWQRATRESSMLIEQISQILTSQKVGRRLRRSQASEATRKVELSEIDIFAVGQGPGIYSNLRISLSALNGLALPDKKPVYGISSAAAIAHEYSEKHRLKKITVIGDARRDRVWYAPFTVDNGQLQDNQPYQLIAIDELSTYLEDGDTIISPDWNRLAEPLADIETNNANIIQNDAIPKASIIGQLAKLQVEQGNHPEFPLAPIYIHPPVFVKPRFPNTNK